MSCQSVLRIGPTDDNVSATVLRNALVDYFSKQQQQQQQQQSDSDSSSQPEEAAAAANEGGEMTTTDHAAAFCVSNRYFTAQVVLKNVNGLYSTSATSPEVDSSSGDDDRLLLPLKEDGIILVFDAARSNPDLPMSSMTAASFDSLDAVHDRAVGGGGANNNNSNTEKKEGEEGEGAGDLLRLCVGVSIGEMQESELRGKNNNSEDEYSRRILWCLDRGYEYVEADLSAEGMAKGHDVRDKDGFARIVEAINGTVWSSAVMGASKKKQLQQLYADDKEKTATSDDDTNNKSKADVDEKEEGKDDVNEYVPPDPSLLATSLVSSEADEEREEKARKALLEQGDIKEEDHDDDDDDDDGYLPAAADESSEPTADEKKIDPAKLRQQRREEQEQEKNFAQLEGALRQASSLRDMAMSGTLSDAERRKHAGDAAMLLMNLMGFDDDDDDDEDDKDDADNATDDEPQGEGGHARAQASKPKEPVKTN